MSGRPARTSIASRRAEQVRPIRLDLLANPYGPSLQVAEAIAAADDLHLPSEPLAHLFRVRLAEVIGVPPDWIVLANGLEELLGSVMLWRRARGPLLLFPPSDPLDRQRADRYGMEVVTVRRAPSFGLGLDVETASDLPPTATALVGSPNDPSGTLLAVPEAVRLIRACEVVVVDERHGAYGGRTLLPLAREFDNLLVVRTFETWAALGAFPLALAVGPPRLLKQLAAFGPGGAPALGALLAASATLDDLPYVQATVERVRAERSRLYRTLRKLNMVRPYPSWANFLLARIERGEAGFVAGELADRGVQVHRPADPELAACLRISAGRPEQTDALKRALIEIGASL